MVQPYACLNPREHRSKRGVQDGQVWALAVRQLHRLIAPGRVSGDLRRSNGPERRDVVAAGHRLLNAMVPERWAEALHTEVLRSLVRAEGRNDPEMSSAKGSGRIRTGHDK